MPQHWLPDVPDFTGWTLEETRAALSASGHAVEIRVVETAPPLRPARDRNARPAKKMKPQEEKRAPRPVPSWGQWRVLRCTSSESDGARIIELLVAREELAPSRTCAVNT